MDLDDIGSDDGRFRHPSSARLGFPSRNDEAVKASLAAVRQAREAALLRRRRQGWTARLGLLGLIGLGMAAWPSAHRLYKNRQTKGSAAVSPAKARATASVATARTPMAAPAAASAPAHAVPPAATPAENANVEETVASCEDTFAARQWHVAADRCAEAFALAPERADLALEVAKAQHARGRFAESIAWANTTLKLAPQDAEAFAIIARSERHAGHTQEANAAYRRYLALAPRGWHAREARRALRGDGNDTAGARSSEPSVERGAPSASSTTVSQVER